MPPKIAKPAKPRVHRGNAFTLSMLAENRAKCVTGALGIPVGPYTSFRDSQHHLDSYLSVPMLKYPEDLRVYEHLIGEARVDCIVEIGLWHGGSTLWFRDRLRALAYYTRRPYRVIAIDTDTGMAEHQVAFADPDYGKTITFIRGDAGDPKVASFTRNVIGDVYSRVMVVEDADHKYPTTKACLAAYSGLVPAGGWYVVEDVNEETGRAIEEFRTTPAGQPWTVRRDVEVYGLTASPGGWLQRV